ncbi:MAG TPA: tRNA (adenosine(37)-N6)-threonylcarbamoyltransferase complex dimerization subunit type 1 TsaB [Pirellulales bacterium]|nr:tRNA (adenosine(37)-N6)-threonylcarbamoyltransferase complex dimerization subunit type 1 TsaB [Pirellulales bacterium]
MRILAIETSGMAGTVAAREGDEWSQELPLDREHRGARTLAPALAELLRQVGWKPRDVQLVAVSVGPGSFTALRVGITTAKTFAYAVSAEILGISTLEVIAAQATGVADAATIATAIDAQRGDVYASLFCRRSRLDHEVLQPPTILRAEEWVAGLTAGTFASGPALEKLVASLPSRAHAIPSNEWFPKACTLAELAAAKHAAGARSDIWRLAPLYLRKSAAEEKIV